MVSGSDARSGLILPPGLGSTPSAGSGAAFGRDFFESVLPQSVQSYCNQVTCTSPVVEVYTIDGRKHYVRAVSAVSERWVALDTQDDGDEPVQVFLPYETVLRVEIHADLTPEMRRLGFLTVPASASETAPNPS